MWQMIRQFLNTKQYLYYIGRHDILPPPLKGQQEKEIIEKAVSGDQKARDLLIEHNLRLVVYVAKRYDNSANCPLEDLISIGTLGLIKGVQTFKMDKNIKLATYASRCIENEILMHLRKTNRIRHEVSLDEPLNVDWDGNELLLSDILGTEENEVYKDIEEDVERQLVFDAINRLKRREREIMYMRFGLCGEDPLTQKEVAQKLDISQSYISRLEKKIIDKIRKEVLKTK